MSLNLGAAGVAHSPSEASSACSWRTSPANRSHFVQEQLNPAPTTGSGEARPALCRAWASWTRNHRNRAPSMSLTFRGSRRGDRPDFHSVGCLTETGNRRRPDSQSRPGQPSAGDKDHDQSLGTHACSKVGSCRRKDRGYKRRSTANRQNAEATVTPMRWINRMHVNRLTLQPDNARFLHRVGNGPQRR